MGLDRVSFVERVEELIRASPPNALVGLCLVGLDPGGDPLLSAVAQRLDQGLTKPGQLLALLSGDEFAILVTGPGLVPGATAEVAGQVVQLLIAPIPVGGDELTVSARIGVVERVAAETTGTDLLSCAAQMRIRMTRAGDRGYWMAVDLDRARAVVRVR